eukprot:CAMPEP_0194265750 /NCGR_PEP_ID=MMETSP0169-20130528/883_1 /TAXON_ID=218684 /ORGANISM="Corethron pennatum, Strain L29A3" /LENGTH=363 /DNA_ID=CAMNT_0039006281 /DNA_START=57 /DNA_END=1148 /DNA_ORIENTATION=-
MSLLRPSTSYMSRLLVRPSARPSVGGQSHFRRHLGSVSVGAEALENLKGRNFMSMLDLSTDELRGILDFSHRLKSAYGAAKQSGSPPPTPLAGDSVSMIFQKRSTRTRVSTETGMSLLGGHALFLGPQDVQLGVNETMRDSANVLSRFNDLILARVYGHADVMELAEHSRVPVINALSDLHHPLQTLADLMTLEERYGVDGLPGKTVAWVGDGNNVLHDLMIGAAKVGMNVRIATPEGYDCDRGLLEATEKIAAEENASVYSTHDPDEAVTGSDVVVTDTWVSMGQEEEYKKRVADFTGYQVNDALMARSNEGSVFLHCLPRHQEEVANEVFYSERSLVFPEAENRMWTVMAVMAAAVGKTKL